MITINHSFWSSVVSPSWAGLHGRNKGLRAVHRLISDCTSWCSILLITWMRDTLRTVIFLLLSSEERGKISLWSCLLGYFAKITLWWILRERKKNVEGASEVALTGDRFLTCFPSHLLWVKARRQSGVWRREKRGVGLGKMVRAAGNSGNAILTSNGGEVFICIVSLSVLNCCGGVQQKYWRGVSYWL